MWPQFIIFLRDLWYFLYELSFILLFISMILFWTLVVCKFFYWLDNKREKEEEND
jgi:hypothetical protein